LSRHVGAGYFPDAVARFTTTKLGARPFKLISPKEK